MSTPDSTTRGVVHGELGGIQPPADRLPPTKHAARTWVAENFPTITGRPKAALILAYGAGFDAGLAEAQEIIMAAADEARKT